MTALFQRIESARACEDLFGPLTGEADEQLHALSAAWRRIAREFEARHWFEHTADESPLERAAMRCLAQLPREQREVIVLKIWHQHTFEMIGELLDLSPNTVAGRYRYGMKKLKARLKDKNYERLESTGEPIAFLDPASSLGQY